VKTKTPKSIGPAVAVPRSALALATLGLLAFGATFTCVRAYQSTRGSRIASPPAMIRIPGGEFTMGTDSSDGWADEKPAHRVRVDGFWMDETDVTNAQFERFVEATGYVTTAEKPPDADEILRQLPPGTPRPPAEKLVPASLVFSPTAASRGPRQRHRGKG
jgi:formylglycine-generating enzyme